MPIERVSKPSSPEAIEPLQKDQNPRRPIKTIPVLKGGLANAIIKANITPHNKPYLVASLSAVAEAMLSRVLEEAVGRIAKKVAEGKRLSDQEIVILYLDIIMRSNERRFEAIDKRFEAIDKRFDDLKEYVDKRNNDLKEYVDKRFESLEKRIEDLKGYVDKGFEAVDKRFESLEKRIDSLERRVELVYNEVSSIKTDIIKMMKEYMERLYGGKKAEDITHDLP